ncbi:MAG: phosphoenolpyruvate--protein phosphotransferase [Kiloniellales bacterium]
MASERVYPAIVASPGIALGPLYVDVSQAAETTARRSPAEEQARLEAATITARTQLEALAGHQPADAAEVLEFQIELLGDPELVAPAKLAIAEGAAAAAAWSETIGALIAEYESEADDYFRARAADLRDLKDRVLRALAGEGGTALAAESDSTGIYVAEELAPSRFLEIDWTRFRGAALTGGNTAGHVAILARARGVPLLIGLEAPLSALGNGTAAVLDAEQGRLVVAPEAGQLARYQTRAAERAAERERERVLLPKPALTAGGERVQLLVNIDDPAVIEVLDPAHCDGVGLTRTELQFYSLAERGGGLPDEEAQLRFYRRLLDWAQGRPVTIRPLDAGGDKPLDGLTLRGETNPFLGVRGLRLSLAHPEVFLLQLRALARAAAASEGKLKVMLPMVTAPWEMTEARRLLEEALAALRVSGIPAARPALGMMVEVPAAALGIERFDADFFSIGSNDLIQYVTATNREEKALGRLYDPLDPGVLELIRRVAAHGRDAGREISLCGDMASDPRCIPALLEAGLRVLSVSPTALGRTKAAIAEWGKRG